MKKLVIALALVATTLFTSSAAFASDSKPTTSADPSSTQAGDDAPASADRITGYGCNGTTFYEFHSSFGYTYAVAVGSCAWWEPDVPLP